MKNKILKSCMIKYKYKSSNTFKYATQLPTASILHVQKLNHIELIRIPAYLTLIETQKQRLPPVDYICFRCGKPNHFIQDCPTNENDLYELKIHKPTGIPKEFLQASANEGGSKNVMITSKGELVQTSARTSEWEQVAPKVMDIPEEFVCEVCKEVLYLPEEGLKCCFKCGLMEGSLDENLWEKVKRFLEREEN